MNTFILMREIWTYIMSHHSGKRGGRAPCLLTAPFVLLPAQSRRDTASVSVCISMRVHLRAQSLTHISAYVLAVAAILASTSCSSSSRSLVYRF